SSTCLRLSAGSSPDSCSLRASLIFSERSRLPTWSALYTLFACAVVIKILSFLYCLNIIMYVRYRVTVKGHTLLYQQTMTIARGNDETASAEIFYRSRFERLNQ